jgi:predicted transcriptional regulator
MKDTNYFTVQGWMVNRLKLSGNELMVYAMIYGFSQDNKSKFKGSYQYLANAIGVSKRSIVTILNKLTKKGLLKKYKNNKCFDYQTSDSPIPEEKAAGEETSPHINNINIHCCPV